MEVGSFEIDLTEASGRFVKVTNAKREQLVKAVEFAIEGSPQPSDAKTIGDSLWTRN